MWWFSFRRVVWQLYVLLQAQLSSTMLYGCFHPSWTLTRGDRRHCQRSTEHCWAANFSTLLLPAVYQSQIRLFATSHTSNFANPGSSQSQIQPSDAQQSWTSHTSSFATADWPSLPSTADNKRDKRYAHWGDDSKSNYLDIRITAFLSEDECLCHPAAHPSLDIPCSWSPDKCSSWYSLAFLQYAPRLSKGRFVSEQFRRVHSIESGAWNLELIRH